MVIMRLPRARVRTYMLLVGIVAVLVWAAMMGSRSYDSYQRARRVTMSSMVVLSLFLRKSPPNPSP